MASMDKMRNEIFLDKASIGVVQSDRAFTEKGIDTMIRFCTVLVTLTVLAMLPAFAHAQTSSAVLKGTPKFTVVTPAHEHKYTASVVLSGTPPVQFASVHAPVTASFKFEVGFTGQAGKTYYLRAGGGWCRVRICSGC